MYATPKFNAGLGLLVRLNADRLLFSGAILAGLTLAARITTAL